MRFAFFLLVFVSLQGFAQVKACTLGDMQANLSRLSEMIRIHNASRDDLLAMGRELSAEAEDQRRELIQQTSAIRVLFSAQLSPGMNKGDKMDEAVCARAEELIARHAGKLPTIAASRTDKSADTASAGNKADRKEEKPHCEQGNIRKRFGEAVRKQRSLRIAGKINPRERMEYMDLASSFNNKLKTDFEEACTILAGYEKRLAQEKVDEKKQGSE